MKTKQEEIKEGIWTGFKKLVRENAKAETLWYYLNVNDVVIKVERGMPYEWGEFTRKHSYRPFKEFTTYTLKSRNGKMFGYIQKYQSLTGYKCFEEPESYSIYLGNEEWAHSWNSKPTLDEAREVLLEQFLHSKDNPDNEIPAGYVAVEPLIGGK